MSPSTILILIQVFNVTPVRDEEVVNEQIHKKVSELLEKFGLEQNGAISSELWMQKCIEDQYLRKSLLAWS